MQENKYKPLVITDAALRAIDAERCIGCKERRRKTCHTGQRQLYCLNRTENERK